MLAAAVALAIAYWGPADCRIAVHVTALPDPVVGRTYNYGSWCEVQVDDGAWRWGELCTVVVHEFGHAHGFGHSTDRRDVMFPVLLRTADVCRGRRPARYRPGFLTHL